MLFRCPTCGHTESQKPQEVEFFGQPILAHPQCPDCYDKGFLGLMEPLEDKPNGPEGETPVLA